MPTNSTSRRTAIPNAARGRTTPSARGSADRRGTGRTSRGRAARKRLVESARNVFERDGFLGARIADICGEAGLSQPSFYTYFETKEELFDEVVSTVDFDMLTMPGGDDLDPIDRIKRANRHYLEFYRDNAQILAVIDQVATFDQRIDESRGERHERFARAIERRIRIQQDAGEADPRVDPYFAANALGGMVTAVAEHLFLHGSRDVDIEQSVEQLTLLWTNAIGLGAA